MHLKTNTNSNLQMPVIRTLFASQSTHWNHNKNKGTAPNSFPMNNTDNTHKSKDVQWQKKGLVNFFAFYCKEKNPTVDSYLIQSILKKHFWPLHGNVWTAPRALSNGTEKWWMLHEHIHAHGWTRSPQLDLAEGQEPLRADSAGPVYN